MSAVVDARTLLAHELEAEDFRNAYEDALNLDSLIDQLIELRRERGLNQSAIARLMGVGQSTVSGFENETTDPRLSTLQRYARALDARVTLQLQVCIESGTWHSASALRSWRESAERCEGNVMVFPQQPWLSVPTPTQSEAASA
jgi:transcriptional regulator with XRE-family HTH domain